MQIQLIPFNSQEHKGSYLSHLEQEYIMSFPEEERRDWTEIIADDFSARLYLISCDNDIVGFVTAWEFGEVLYLEHLLISSSQRGAGIGARVIHALKDLANGKHLLLECEPAHTAPMAQRRLDFYTRLGFVKQDFDYVQPPYREGGVSVPLHLMATANLTQDMLIRLKQTLYEVVYRQK